MKRLLFIISILLPMTIAAQEATFRDMRRDTSTRGVEFSIKAIGSPGGFHDVYNAEGYVCGGVGGEAVLYYRVNKAFAVGFGVNYLRGWYDRRNKVNESSSFFFSLKVSFNEKPKFIPYVSLSYGMDWLDMLDGSFSDPVSANSAAVYGKNSYSMILTPAGGLDFPLRRGGTAFVEVRFDYRITDLYLPSLAVGYTF